VLLRDGAEPLYAHERDGSPLYCAARRALLAMRPCAPTTVGSSSTGRGQAHADAISIALAVVAFALLYAAIAFLDRV
jgi:hypothetical protein